MAHGRADFTFLSDVDVTAQTLAQLNVDIIAQTLSAVDINITAQDLAQLIISIAAQTVGVYLQPEWASKTGIDKLLYTAGDDKAYGEIAEGEYTVPIGKELRINLIAGFSKASAAGDADNNQIFRLLIWRGITLQLVIGGNASIVLPLSTPLIFDANDIVTYQVECEANHDCDIGVFTVGYEVTL